MITNKARIKNFIRNQFGKNPTTGYNYYNAENRLDEIRRYHNGMKGANNNKRYIDEVTWNDLEMDKVFLRINHTNSFIGEQVLYHRLHTLWSTKHQTENNLDLNCATIKNENVQTTKSKKININNINTLDTSSQESHLSLYEENPKLREEIEANLYTISKQDEGYYLYDFLTNTDLWKIGNVYIYHMLQLLLIFFSIAGVIFDSMIGFAGLACVVAINFIVYSYTKQKFDIYFKSVIMFKRVYDCATNICKKMPDGFKPDDQTKTAIKKLSKLSRLIFNVESRSRSALSSDISALLMEYIQGVFLIDVSFFNYIMKVIDNDRTSVMLVLDYVGDIDAEISIASYRKSLTKWCRPEFIEHGIMVKGVAHPLIEDPVTNDWELTDRAMITGSNASGKSTFMKCIAMNVILAQTINTCIAEEMYLEPLDVVTCMALRDDVTTGESYYLREAKCIKRMLDRAQSDSVLFVIDEILKGTNTTERIAASKAILEYIGNTKAYAIVATHDNELTSNNSYRQFYFGSSIENDNIIFDYRIHEGINTRSNAIALLAFLGYPASIVEKAKVNINENRRNSRANRA
jgi:hypothetical protein